MKQIDCIFCQIAENSHNTGQKKLFEDKDFYIILSTNPQTPGHSLIIPKSHYADLIKMPIAISNLLFKETIMMGELLKKKLRAKAYTIKVNNQLYQLEEDKGHVGHIHIHVIPRYKKTEVKEFSPKRASEDELSAILEKIGKIDKIMIISAQKKDKWKEKEK